jgi:hypothetical protein
MVKGTAISCVGVGADAMDVSVTSAKGGTHGEAIARELIPMSRHGDWDIAPSATSRVPIANGVCWE